MKDNMAKDPTDASSHFVTTPDGNDYEEQQAVSGTQAAYAGWLVPRAKEVP
jgi:hypothetical protein